MNPASPARLFALLLAAASVPHALAGPLDPPGGPIVPTHKTLTEVEPRIPISAATTPGDADSVFRITQPGSYYLTGNITGVAAKHGIEIASSGVAIDLAGFDLVGVPGSLDGIITSAAGFVTIEVQSGSLRNWGGDGLDFAANGAEGAIVRGLRSAANGGSGIRVGSGIAVIACTAQGNLGPGIFTVFGCKVADCVAVSNVGTGIVTASGANITGCTSYANDGDGISAATGSTVSGNTCRANNGHGVRVSGSCTVTNNTCSNNGQGVDPGAGISVSGSANRIDANHCTGQDRGIQLTGDSNFIIRNTCSNNVINWDIVGNNYYGPIINRSGVLTPAVSGDAAAGVLASTDPHANFTY